MNPKESLSDAHSYILYCPGLVATQAFVAPDLCQQRWLSLFGRAWAMPFCKALSRHVKLSRQVASAPQRVVLGYRTLWAPQLFTLEENPSTPRFDPALEGAVRACPERASASCAGCEQAETPLQAQLKGGGALGGGRNDFSEATWGRGRRS